MPNIHNLPQSKAGKYDKIPPEAIKNPNFP